MVPSGWLLLSQYELSSPRPEESSFICCFQEPSPDKDITWGLRTTGFIPDLFRLSVTFYNFIHFLKKQTVYTFVLGTQFLGHSPCSSGDIFFLSVWPHTGCISKSLSVKTGTKSTLKGQMHNPRSRSSFFPIHRSSLNMFSYQNFTFKYLCALPQKSTASEDFILITMHS